MAAPCGDLRFKSARNCIAKLFLNGDQIATRTDFTGPLNPRPEDAVQIAYSYTSEKVRLRNVPTFKLDDLSFLPRALNAFEIKAMVK
jgi:hypothetical protein